MKNILTILMILIFSAGIFAQGSFTDFKIGLLMPSDAETGFIGGIGFGKMVDEKVGAGLELNYYGKTFTKETKVAEDPATIGTTGSSTYVTEIENSTTLIPIMFNVVLVTQAGPNFDLRFTGGVGYELLWVNENNYQDGYEDTRFYSGFAWQVGAGASIPMSRNSDIFAEAMYHGGSPSKDEGKELGLPVRTEVDMSGFMVRLGIRLYNFGF
ncbi:MAG: outer membrane beta-barrel protein [Calditrichia bacterium]|nr:outer membrane beta-barrel protein [Calditrichia bacterium]